MIPLNDQIMALLHHYFINGGYPEQLKQKDLNEYQQKTRTYIQFTLYKDIIRLFNVRDPGKLELLLTFIAEEGMHGSSYESLCNALQIRKETLLQYIRYLEYAFLISQSRMYSRNIRKKEINPKKIYVCDTGIRNALLDQFNGRILSDESEMGKIAETVVHDHAMRLKHNLNPAPVITLSYWKEKNEVDIVLEHAKKGIPIEVKYKNRILESDKKGLNQFLKKNQGIFGIMVTKNEIYLHENILEMPLWMFLLMC